MLNPLLGFSNYKIRSGLLFPSPQSALGCIKYKKPSLLGNFFNKKRKTNPFLG